MKPENAEKTLGERTRTNNTLNPRVSGNQTQVTLVGGNYSYHSTTAAPHIVTLNVEEETSLVGQSSVVVWKNQGYLLSLHCQDFKLIFHQDGPCAWLIRCISCSSLLLKESFFFRQVCEHTYGVAPGLIVNGHTKAVFPYIPAPLEYILQELLKNAMRLVFFTKQN